MGLVEVAELAKLELTVRRRQRGAKDCEGNKKPGSSGQGADMNKI